VSCNQRGRRCLEAALVLWKVGVAAPVRQGRVVDSTGAGVRGRQSRAQSAVLGMLSGTVGGVRCDWEVELGMEPAVSGATRKQCRGPSQRCQVRLGCRVGDGVGGVTRGGDGDDRREGDHGASVTAEGKVTVAQRQILAA
jgi:hypothetical protein